MAYRGLGHLDDGYIRISNDPGVPVLVLRLWYWQNKLREN